YCCPASRTPPISAVLPRSSLASTSYPSLLSFHLFFFFFNDTAPPEISPLSLHAALPICRRHVGRARHERHVERASHTRHARALRSEEHTSELQSLTNLVCRLLLEKKKKKNRNKRHITLGHKLVIGDYNALSTSTSHHAGT